MSTVDTFPVAAQEKQTTPEGPDFASQVLRLEEMVLDGIDTPQGTESFQFRTGIEIEFALIDPEKFREALDTSEADSRTLHEERMGSRTQPLSDEARAKLDADSEKRIADSRKFHISTIKNPDYLDGSVADTSAVVDDFRAYAIDFISRLPAYTPEEESRRAKWLAEVPNFGIKEVINFLIYEEFSKPTLSDVTPPGDDALQSLDDYSEARGWLEFRFGTGTLQTGYYDNEGMSEVRMAPCLPSEAIRRKEMIDKRIAEIASQFGVLVQSTSNHEHVNLSVYKQDPDGTYTPIIGQDAERREATLDITSGIAEGFQDGVWLNQKDMKWGYKFNSKHGGESLRFGPSRKSVRVINGRLELRSTFAQADQALNWLVAGAISGIQHGHRQLTQEGYQTLVVNTIYRVHRADGFDKHTHLEIQRAFENSEMVDDDGEEKFELNVGYNLIGGEGITRALLGDLGEQENLHGCDIFNEVVMGCIRVSSNGAPVLSSNKLALAYKKLPERKQQFIDKFVSQQGGVKRLAEKINQNLQTVRLEAVEVVAGEITYKVDGAPAAVNRLRDSSVGQLAYGPVLEEITTWLESGIPEEPAK